MNKKDYKRHRNILRNNVPKDFSKGVRPKSFAGYCLVSRFYQYEKQFTR